MKKELISGMPKIELHVHLDGSVSLNTLQKLSGLSMDLVKEKAIAPLKCHNLKEYLESFSFPISLMQTKDNLELVAKSLIEQFKEDNVIYAEVRFCPLFHTMEGLTINEVIESVLKGLRSTKVKTNLILCIMRGSNYNDWMEIVKAYKHFKGKGVCAIDLAGDEGKYPIDDYVEVLSCAHEEKINLTIHAGEVLEDDEIKKAINCGTRRIGHGIKCINNKKAYNLIKNKNILLEICPTSNVQTNNVDNYINHPVDDFKNELKISINTDNRTVSNITLNKEYKKLQDKFHWTIKDLLKTNIESIDYCFISEKEKIELLKTYQNFIKKSLL